MKLKKEDFKAMLKECILELVQEGKLFQNLPPSIISEQKNNSQIQEVKNTVLDDAINLTTQLVSKGKNAEIYKSIIADTAKTTLQKQITANVKLGGGSGDLMFEQVLTEEQKNQDQSEIGIFSAKNRWAQLAFNKKAPV